MLLLYQYRLFQSYYSLIFNNPTPDSSYYTQEFQSYYSLIFNIKTSKIPAGAKYDFNPIIVLFLNIHHLIFFLTGRFHFNPIIVLFLTHLTVEQLTTVPGIFQSYYSLIFNFKTFK